MIVAFGVNCLAAEMSIDFVSSAQRRNVVKSIQLAGPLQIEEDEIDYDTAFEDIDYYNEVSRLNFRITERSSSG